MPTTLSARRKGGFRLLRYFSIASLVVIVLTLIGLGFFFRQTAIKQLNKVAEDNNVSLSRAFANMLKPHYIPLIAAAEKLDADEVRANPAIVGLHEAILGAVHETHVVKVKIYDAKGRTIYSSELGEIGEDRGLDAEFAVALAGGVMTEVRPAASLVAFGHTLDNRDFVVTRIPVRRLEFGDADAVLQVYSDATPHFAEIRRTQMNLRIGVGTVLIILYGALFFIAKRADSVIRRQAGQREADEATIRHLAHHDTLTGLPNRKLFTDRLLVTLARARRSGRMAALMFIDLDHFKAINDTLGHAAGDRVLQAAGNRLRGLLRDIDTVARLGGDEFTIILEDIADRAHVAPVAQKIKEAFAAPVVMENGTDIEVTLSIGIAFYPVDGEDVDALMQAADASMYEAKAAGRNTYRFHRPSLALAAS